MNTDLLIVGAGPAGLSAAQYGARAGLKVKVIEQLAIGGQALLIDRLENYPGNIGAGVPGSKTEPKSGFEVVEDMRRQAATFGAEFVTGTVKSIVKSTFAERAIFEALLGNGETLRAFAVIIATGTKHRTLDVPGEERLYGRGVSYCATCDGPFFKNKKIFVIGGGDSACDEAQYLSRLSKNVIMIHRRNKLRAQVFLSERTLHNPNIEVRFNTRLLEIKGEQKTASVVLENVSTGEKNEENADAVFIFAGSTPQIPHIEGIKTDESGYIETNQRMESSIAGIFAAGDVRATPFRQVVVAASEGAIAAHCAAPYIESLT
jgi:thioredoxin reductase (NADPH)